MASTKTATKKKTPAKTKAVVTTKPANAAAVKAAVKINELHNNAAIHTMESVKMWIDVGAALTAYKEKTPHGQWIPFVDKHLNFGRQQASRYMKIYADRNVILKIDATSMNKALAQIAPPEDDDLDIDMDMEPEDERDQRIADLEEKLKEAQLQVDEFQNDSSNDDLQISYDEVLTELEELKKQGHETDSDVEAAIEKLKKMREKLRKDVSGMEDLARMLKKTRDFFAREIALVPTLKISKAVIKHTAGDVEALVELMENWVTAMKEKFDV